MKAFITGGSGFIGTNLVAELLGHGYEVLSFDKQPPLDARQHATWMEGNILDGDVLARALSDFRPDVLVHLAARVDCKGTTLDEYRDNTDGTASVLGALAATRSLTRALITSTEFVCQPGYMPRHDEDYSPHTVYGESKVITERLTRRAELSCGWTIIRPTTIWGPWLMRHRQEVFRVMRRGLYVHPGRKPVVRSWGYVGNVAWQIRRLLEAPAGAVDHRTYYLGDEPRDLHDWVDAVSRGLTGHPVRVVPRGVVRLLAGIGDVAARVKLPSPITTSRYRSMTQDYLTPMEPTFALLGPAPHSLESGVAATLAWLESVEGESGPGPQGRGVTEKRPRAGALPYAAGGRRA